MDSPDRTSASDAPLLTESEKYLEDGLPGTFHENSYGPKQRSRWWQHWSVSLLLLLAYSLVLLKLPDLWSAPSLDPFLTYTPAREAVKYRTEQFDGSLGLRTKYIGEPRPETEEAWGALFQHYNLRLTGEEMQKLNRTDNRIELPDDGGFFGQLSAYHHLHCLKMLRHIVWHDLYNISIAEFRGHADHCIDDIRQSLMCHADLSVVTFYWDPEIRRPMPNFHLDQTCVDWDALDAWASKRSFSIFDEKTLVHPQLGLSFPKIDGKFQLGGGIDPAHAHDFPPVWPAGDTEHTHSEHDHSEHDNSAAGW